MIAAPAPLRRAALLAAALLVLAAMPAAAQKYVAFGDSITDGIGDSESVPEPERGYVPRLQNRLRANGQPDAVVVDRGVGAENTLEGLSRITQVLDQEAGDVLLLMEGTNDISNRIPPETTLFNLQQMAQRASSRGYETVHATLIPRIPLANVDAENVLNTRLNQEIRHLAGSNGRRLVDNFHVFGAIPNVFLSHYWDSPQDGVGHPDAQGYDVMADAFLNVLIGNDEVPPVPGLTNPIHDSRQVPTGVQVRVDLWDFGVGVDVAATRLTINGQVVDAQISGGGERAQIFYSPSAPFRGVVRVGLVTADLATPPNTFEGDVFRFVTAGTTFIPGDFDLSGRVDGADLVHFGRLFGSSDGTSRYERRADFNSDGVIDGEDLAVFASNFGTSSF